MSSAATQTETPRTKAFTCAQFHGTRFDLNEGRDWLITTEEGHAYVVTIWAEEELGRMASCRCKAFTFGQLCRHIIYAQAVDTTLTGAPMRAIRPVPYEAETVNA
jgi:hypothetical protein